MRVKEFDDSQNLEPDGRRPGTGSLDNALPEQRAWSLERLRSSRLGSFDDLSGCESYLVFPPKVDSARLDPVLMLNVRNRLTAQGYGISKVEASNWALIRGLVKSGKIKM